MGKRGVISGMMFQISLTTVRHIAKEQDFLRLQPPHHFPVAAEEQLPGRRAFLSAYGRHRDGAAHRFAIKAPGKRRFVAPADRGDHRHAQPLPVRAQQVLAPVVVDLHRHGIVGKQAEIGRHHDAEIRKHLRVPIRIMPYALKEIIVDKKMHAQSGAHSAGFAQLNGIKGSIPSSVTGSRDGMP